MWELRVGNDTRYVVDKPQKVRSFHFTKCDFIGPIEILLSVNINRYNRWGNKGISRFQNSFLNRAEEMYTSN